MKKLILLLLFVPLISYGQVKSDCPDNKKLDDTSICLPQLLKMTEVNSIQKYKNIISNYITPDEIVLGFYATDEALSSIKSGKVCQGNCNMIKVYSLKVFADKKITLNSTLESIYETILDYFENGENLVSVINDAINFTNISFERPVLIEKFNSNPEIKSAVLMSPFYNSDLDKNFVQLVVINFTIINQKLIIYAHYSWYDGPKSIKDAKNSSDYFGLRLLSENKKTSKNNDYLSLGNYVSLKDHPKAKGVNIKLKKPLSMKKEEGIRPNIVSKFINEDRTISYMIQINNLPNFYSRNTVKEMFLSKKDREDFLKTFLDTDGNIFSSKRVVIDNYPAIEYIHEYEVERMDKKAKIKAVRWIIVYEDKIIILSGSVSGTAEKFDKYFNLYYLITNSIVLEDQYNSISNNFVGDNQDFSVYVDQFYRELEFFGIYKTRPQNIKIKLMPLDSFKNSNHLHGFSLGSNNDKKIEIYINKRSWNTFSRAQKYYLIFHELCHDVLNLKDLASNNVNSKHIMFPSIDAYKNLSMDDFIENFYVLLEEYKEPISNNIKNATYYYNLGVSTADSGDPIKARVYLERAIELDPEFEDPYNYLIILLLTGEKKIIEEMNSLSVSKADNLRYDVLKRQRDDLYKDCVPLLEKSIKINKNQLKIKLLMDVYGTLGDTVGYNKMKKMLD
tara:strand:- start:225 stop:2249 length:2025 start_codon:yes stop_codon:yes gene_type:complete